MIESIKRVANSEDKIQIGRKTYLIRFSPKYAEHVMDNFSDKDHQIKHREILSLIKDSIFIRGKKERHFCVGKFKNLIYHTVVIINKDLLEVLTSCRCHKEELRKLYLDNEN